jgi:hypothetical protein
VSFSKAKLWVKSTIEFNTQLRWRVDSFIWLGFLFGGTDWLSNYWRDDPADEEWDAAQEGARRESGFRTGGWREDPADEEWDAVQEGAGRESGFRTGGWREDPADEEWDAAQEGARRESGFRTGGWREDPAEERLREHVEDCPRLPWDVRRDFTGWVLETFRLLL